MLQEILFLFNSNYMWNLSLITSQYIYAIFTQLLTFGHSTSFIYLYIVPNA